MQGHEGETGCLRWRGKLPHRSKQYIAGHIACEHDVTAHSFMAERSTGSFGGRTKNVRQSIYESTIQLLGHLTIHSAKASLHMHDREPQLRSRQGHAQGRIGIADDNNGAGSYRPQEGF